MHINSEHTKTSIPVREKCNLTAGNTLQLTLKQLRKTSAEQVFINLLKIKRKHYNDVIQTVHKIPNTKISVPSTWYTPAK